MKNINVKNFNNPSEPAAPIPDLGAHQEIASIVDEEFHRKGIAMFICDCCIEIDRDGEIDRLADSFLPDNRAMVKL